MKILMSKMHFVLIGLLWEMLKSSKKLKKIVVSSYDIAKELNIDHKIILEYL